MFGCVPYNLGAFETVWLPYETLVAVRAELVQKFVPRSRVGFLATNAPGPPYRTLK